MKKWSIAGIGNARFMTAKDIILNSRGTYQSAHATGSQRKETSAMDCDNREDVVTIRKSVYESLIAKDVISTIRGLYMDKIGTGEMAFDKKIADLITELEEIFI